MYANVNNKRAEFAGSFKQDGNVFYQFRCDDGRLISLRASHPDIVVLPNDLIPNPSNQALRNGRRAERLTVPQALRLAYNCLDEEGRARLQALFLGHLKQDDRKEDGNI